MAIWQPECGQAWKAGILTLIFLFQLPEKKHCFPQVLFPIFILIAYVTMNSHK